MNTFLVFSVIVIILGEECFQSINAHEYTVKTTNVMYHKIN